MNTPSSTPQFLTFDELGTRESVTREVILATLDEYVSFGAPIVTQLVLALTENCQMTSGDWMQIESLAKRGAIHHERTKNAVAAKEYRDLEAYASEKIDFSGIGDATTGRVKDVLKNGE